MDEFINKAVSQLGLDESTTRNATGSVFGFLKESLGDDFSQLADKLPDVEGLISQASGAVASEGGGGMLGGLMNAASSVLGGSAGEGLELMGMLKKLGLSTEKASELLAMVVNYLKETLGDDVIKMIIDKVPALKALIG